MLKCANRKLEWDECRFTVFNDGVSGGGGGGCDSINSNNMKNLRLNKSLRTLHEGYSARNSEVCFKSATRHC
jgi:hypothetical protein